MTKRISRDEMLMSIASTIAARSTCLRTSVGAIIARDGRIIATGYNGAPSGWHHCTPDICGPDKPCTRTVHAEANAIAFAARYGLSTDHASLYTTWSPCFDCAKLIINAGISEVVWLNAYRDTTPLQFLTDSGIYVRAARS